MRLAVAIGVGILAVLSNLVQAQEVDQLAVCSKLYAYSLDQVFAVQDTNSTYCLRIKVEAPPGCTSYCCTQADLHRIEFKVNPACNLGGVAVTVNGTAKPFSRIVRAPEGPPGNIILRLVQLGLTTATANGVEICIMFDTSRAHMTGCSTLQQLCSPTSAGVPASVCPIFHADLKNACCATSKINVAGPRLPPPIAKKGLKPPPSPSLPPSPPPSPSPPPPGLTYIPGSCTVCVYIVLNPTLFLLFPYSFSQSECDNLTNMIINDLYQQAFFYEATVVTPFTAFECSPQRIKVCGAFASDYDADLLQSSITFMTYFWMRALLGNSDSCPPYLFGYDIVIAITGDYDNMVAPSDFPSNCLYDIMVVNCKQEPVDFPKCTCNKNALSTQFAVKPVVTKTPGRKATNTLYCFEFTTLTPSALSSGGLNAPGQSCANASVLYKVEFWADASQYRTKLTGVGLQPNGAQRMNFSAPPVWGPTSSETLKVTALNWEANKAKGAKICLELDRSISLEAFCKGPGTSTCWLSVQNPTSCSNKQNATNTSQFCCPLYAAALR